MSPQNFRYALEVSFRGQLTILNVGSSTFRQPISVEYYSEELIKADQKLVVMQNLDQTLLWKKMVAYHLTKNITNFNLI